MQPWRCGWTAHSGAARANPLNPLKPGYRAALAFAHDVLASAACWVLAFWLRFNLELPPEEFLPALAAAVAAAVPLPALLFWSLGLYPGSWRHPRLPHPQRIAVACPVGAAALPPLLSFV